MALLTVTPNFPDSLFRINDFFSGLGQGSVRYSSPTTIVLGTPSLNRVVITGTKLYCDPTQGNSWAGGTVTSITLWNRTYDTKIAEITGLNVDLSEVGPRIGESIYGTNGLVSFLFSGDDSLVGSDHSDSLHAFDGNDTVNAGAGDDDIAPGKGNDTVNGEEGFDIVTYWNLDIVDCDDTTYGVNIDLALPEVVDPWGGQDQLISIEGVEGSIYADRLYGDNRNNSLYGLDGNDFLYGRGGNDFFSCGQGADTVEGGLGFDTLSYADYAGHGTLTANLLTGEFIDPWGQTDLVRQVENVRGTGNGDSFQGSERDESVQGMGGDDTIDGGAGIDAVSYSADRTRGGLSGVEVDLAAGTARDGFGTVDHLVNIENVFGTAFADEIAGDGEANSLYGSDGSDRLSGREGGDWLYGGDGNDVLTGGSGQDGFVFDAKPNSRSNVDRITDFSVRDDTIYLAKTAFPKIKAGWLSPSAFVAGTRALDGSDRIIYNKSTGALSYDPDGTGKAAAIKIATLTKGLKLTNYDFAIY